MLGFTKDEIIQRANDWITKNQSWADSVVADAVAKAGLNPAAQLEAASLANFRIVLPTAIAEIMEAQNILMEKQIKQLIDDALNRQ